MSTLQQKIAGMLGKKDRLTSAQCAEQIEKITSRLKEIRARVANISDAVNGRGEILGKTRRRVSETGSPQELLALDDEVRLLDLEEQSLCFQRGALRKRQKAAVIEEAPGLAKAAIKKLPAALGATEATKAAHNKAVAALEELKNEITAQRRIATDAGIEAPFVKPADFDRLAALLGWDYREPVFISESNVRNARADRRAELTGWTREQPVEPKMPWQQVERLRQAKARKKHA